MPPIPKRPGWKIYKEQMFRLDHGDALWEPAPIHSYKRIRVGDVGYVRRGRFHLLFSAGCPLGERQLGIDVPSTFKPLRVGPLVYSQPRLPGHLSTNTVRETGAGLGISMSPVPYAPSITFDSSSPSVAPSRMLEPGVNLSFELTEKQGAALVTKYRTYREDAELESAFKSYTKRHYDSWVAFARDTEHGDDIKPILVTGVDMTRDFAMMAYSNDSVSLASEFTTSVPTIAAVSASAWGTWRTEGLIHTNYGPQTCCPPSQTQTTDLTPSGNGDTEIPPDEYNQCVFVRYYTMRKRALMFPRVMRGAAGPHDLGPGGRDDEELLEVEAPSDSDSDSDIVSSLWDDGDDDRSSDTSIDSESDIVVHNTASDEVDDFDIIADYVFQNSDADSVLIHHRDIALLRKSGGDADILTLLFEKRPHITVDDSGVGTIGNETAPTRDTQRSGLTSGGLASSEIFDNEGNDASIPYSYVESPDQEPFIGFYERYAQEPPFHSFDPYGRGQQPYFSPRNVHQSWDVLAGTRNALIDPDPRVAWANTRRDIPGWIHEVAEECSPLFDSNQADEQHTRHVTSFQNSHFMRQDPLRQFVNEHPFMVFVLGGGRVSIPIVVTASSTIDDLLDILAQRRIIPANDEGTYALCYGRVGSLSGSSTMASLGAGPLSHFQLRTRVLGGAGHVLGSKGSSTSSESSAAPRLVEGKRVKWLSDEDVFGYADVIAENLRPLCPPLRDDDCYLYLPTHSPLFGSLEPVTLAYGVSDGRNDPDTVANIDPYPTSLWLSPSPTIAPVSLPVSEPPRIRIEWPGYPSSYIPAPTLPSLNRYCIPQKSYDHGQRQRDFPSSESIDFGVNGHPGVKMRDALLKNFKGLDSRDELVSQDASSSCRLLFPGYPLDTSPQISTIRWNKRRDPNQLRTFDWYKPPKGVSLRPRSKLSTEVAERIRRFVGVRPHAVDNLVSFGPEDVLEDSRQCHLLFNRPDHRPPADAKPQVCSFGIAKIMEESTGNTISKTSGLLDNSTGI